jgi:hypothetical protein
VIGVLAVAAVIAAASPTPPPLSVVAELGGHATSVVCAPLRDHPGMYQTLLNRIVLSPTVCADLQRLQEGEIDTDSAFAVLVFAHEVMHSTLQWRWLLGITEADSYTVRDLAAPWHDAIRALPGYGTRPCPA